MRPSRASVSTAAGGTRDGSERGGPAPLFAQDLEPEQVRGHWQVRDTFDCVRVARASQTAHVAEERLHGREIALDVDEDRAIVLVRDAADHAVAMGCLGDSRAVVHALDAAMCDTVPVDNRGRGRGQVTKASRESLRLEMTRWMAPSFPS